MPTFKGYIYRDPSGRLMVLETTGVNKGQAMRTMALRGDTFVSGPHTQLNLPAAMAKARETCNAK